MFSLRCPVDIREERWGRGFRGEVWTEDVDLDLISAKLGFIAGVG